MNGNEMPRILMVDDNPEIREVVNILLSGEGCQVDEASNGAQALQKIQKTEYDLVILDVMMPQMNGYQTCLEIRKHNNTPILFLSARSQVEDKTLGFSSGGDDYLPNPFSYQELLSRFKSLIRRYQVYRGKEYQEDRHSPNARQASQNERVISLPGIEIYEQQEKVLSEGTEIELTDIEFAILHLLAGHRGQIFSARHLYESIWEEDYYYGASNTVMVHIRNLRGKIEKDPHNPKIIKNVWGKGYRCE